MPLLTDLVEQNIHIVPSFELENGAVLKDAPVAYKTWGKLNEARDNVMIICHAFTGSADVEDWWGPLMGRNKAFDPNRFFIFCANVLGSPYGSASPVTINPDTGKPYGPKFPLTTIRDDVRIHKIVLDSLGVASVAVVIGGSMGGMAVLEWPLCTPQGYVRHVIPLATSARHSAWCISWGEAQRQSIYSDPGYKGGFYENLQPASGLAAARMSALLTYRSRDSFESRFGRKPQKVRALASSTTTNGVDKEQEHLGVHNDGLRNIEVNQIAKEVADASSTGESTSPKQPIFSAQSYLRYQGEKFIQRFDANCYIHITRKLDTHDIARGRVPSSSPSSFDDDSPDALTEVLARLPPRALVISIATDGLFTPLEQKTIADAIPDATLVTIESPDGHDGFLLEFEEINRHVMEFLRREFPGMDEESEQESGGVMEEGEGFEVKKSSVFGEAEADITAW
ncbi:homoserine O-acetyltransferase [Coprinopsis sp. MPI-PUGE-AT-0042]|nr:homoserine O-acetyltransferase [Coprinopsis sp. MPI-PUGE-AT-0042]